MISVTRSLRNVCKRIPLDKHADSLFVMCNNKRISCILCISRASFALQIPKFYSVKFSGTNYADEHGFTDSEERRILILQETFKCSRKEAQPVVREYSFVARLSENALLTNTERVKQQGLTWNVVCENPWVITLSPGDLDMRLSVIRKFDLISTHEAVPLLQITMPRLKFMCFMWHKERNLFPGGSRFKYLSDELQCPVAVACQLVVKYRFLQTVSSGRLKRNLDLLLSAGISPNYMLKDMWSLRNSPKFVAERLRRAKEAGLPDMKPWIVRCKSQVFERTLERHLQSQALLGTKSVHEFLADKLNCDVQTAIIMTQKYPNVLRVNIPKMNEILEFLLQQGFSVEQIQQVPRILCHSLETTRSRLKQLQALEFNPLSLMVLCQSQPEYHKLVLKLEQRKARLAQ